MELKVNRVERHIIRNDKHLDYLCFLSKNLYNISNYYIKRRFEKSGRFLSAFTLIPIMRRINQVDFRALPSQTSGNIIKLLETAWRSYFKACKEYKKNPGKFKGQPQPPQFKNKKYGRNVLTFYNDKSNSVKWGAGFFKFPKQVELPVLKTNINLNKIAEVRIIPKLGHHIIEVVYEKEVINYDLNKEAYLGIDLGINNLATCISNIGLQPFIINGKIIKAENQYYNKEKSRLQTELARNKTLSYKSSNRIKKLALKRDNIISNGMHQASRKIIDYCIQNKIGNIVIGHNKGWKQNVNLGKSNNQKFVGIPFNKLISQIQYKAEEVGIKVIIIEEGYTSKVDHLAYEQLGHHETYLGKRKERGLFQSSIGKLINADVNGAIGILRKVIGDDFIKNLTNRGVGCTPIKKDFNKESLQISDEIKVLSPIG